VTANSARPTARGHRRQISTLSAFAVYRQLHSAFSEKSLQVDNTQKTHQTTGQQSFSLKSHKRQMECSSPPQQTRDIRAIMNF
jgi:hypothetical protein